MVKSAAPSPMQAAALNANMRMALLSTAPRGRKEIATVRAEAGQTSRVKLFNVGVITGLQLHVTAALTIGTAVATASPRAPWNLISKLKVSDFDGTDRVNLSGFQLFVLNCVRNRRIFGYNNGGAITPTGGPVLPAVPTAVGAVTLGFFLDVPLAFDVDNPIPQLQDLRGAILAQTAVGEMYLSIDWNPTLYGNGNVDAVYNGGATTTVVGNGANYISCTVWQNYLLPQAVGAGGAVPLPGIDLTTVYELNGAIRSSDNIVVGTEKLISYPNMRSVIGLYANYIQASVQASGNVSRFRLIANGNNVLAENTEHSQLFDQRNHFVAGQDLTGGAYFFTHREKPMETALLGNLQLGVTPSTVGANPAFEIAVESFYTKGQALPGLNLAQ